MSDINEMNVGLRWYVAHTYSGYENKVKTSLEKIVENRGLGNLIYDIRIPVETVIEKDGDTYHLRPTFISLISLISISLPYSKAPRAIRPCVNT